MTIDEQPRPATCSARTCPAGDFQVGLYAQVLTALIAGRVQRCSARRTSRRRPTATRGQNWTRMSIPALDPLLRQGRHRPRPGRPRWPPTSRPTRSSADERGRAAARPAARHPALEQQGASARSATTRSSARSGTSTDWGVEQLSTERLDEREWDVRSRPGLRAPARSPLSAGASHADYSSSAGSSTRSRSCSSRRSWCSGSSAPRSIRLARLRNVARRHRSIERETRAARPRPADRSCSTASGSADVRARRLRREQLATNEPVIDDDHAGARQHAPADLLGHR